MTATRSADILPTRTTSVAKAALKGIVPALALAAGGFALSTPAAASDWGMHAPHVQPDSMHVDVNRTHVLRLPRPAAAVVVGNPSIADIAVHTTDTILVLGRNYGSTNILAFDSAGGILSETRIEVGETPSDSRLRIYQGANARQTYECRGECVPAPAIGDSPEFRAVNVNEAQRPVTDTVVSRAGTDFGDTAGRPFTSQPSPSFSGASEPQGFPGTDAPGLPFSPPTQSSPAESFSPLD